MYIYFQELGGSNEFCWSIEDDEILQKYGKGYVEQLQPELPSLESISRSPSIDSSSESNDEFYDAQETLPPLIPQPQLPSIPPPNTLTIRESHPLPVPQNARPVYGNLSSWAGLRMGVDFLTSFIDTKPPQPVEKDVIVVEPFNPPPPQLMTKHHFLFDIETFSKNLINQVIHISFGPHQGVAYWVLLYLFLRGPVESVVQKSLVHSSLVESKRITSTTIGVTAAVAAVLGTGLTNTLDKFRR